MNDEETASLIAALSRQDLLNKDDASKYREPAALYDELNPDWLPTLLLGHRKREWVVYWTSGH